MDVPSCNPENLERAVGRSAFGQDASGYHLARSGYPAALFENLAHRAPANPRVLEIGAGTGLATNGLLDLSPYQLTLVEPDPRLCDFLSRNFTDHSAEVVCGPFPNNDVADKYDLIACAAAFHWLQRDEALAAIKKLLAPGGVWAMWWNAYFGHGVPDPFGDAAIQILHENAVVLPPSYRGDRHYAFDRALHVTQLERSGFHDIEHLLFRDSRKLDPEAARALFQTFSFVSLLDDRTKGRVLDQIGNLVDRKFAGRAPLVVMTSAFVCSHGSIRKTNKPKKRNAGST